MIIRTFVILALVISISVGSPAQNPIDRTLETFSFALGTLGLGTAESDFLMTKATLKKTVSERMPTREEVVEPIAKNGIASITYYFDAKDPQPMYELIIELDNELICAELAEKLFGAPNYPDKPNYWIAGIAEDVVTMGWIYGKKLVIATNFPGTEWYGDPLFKVPAGFQLFPHTPMVSEWPKDAQNNFFSSLENQIKEAATDFKNIRGEALDGVITCKAPLSGAVSATVFLGDNSKWAVSNIMVSGETPDNSILWKLDLANKFNHGETGPLKLTHIKSNPEFGRSMDLWDVADKTGKQLQVQIGLHIYAFGEEGHLNIHVLVLKK